MVDELPFSDFCATVQAAELPNRMREAEREPDDKEHFFEGHHVDPRIQTLLAVDMKVSKLVCEYLVRGASFDCALLVG